MRIPWGEPDITAAERGVVLEPLDTMTLSIGPKLALFERRLAEYVRAPHAIGVISGTARLRLAMLAVGVGEGDVVLPTPFSRLALA